jgi:hypothetical protein
VGDGGVNVLAIDPGKAMAHAVFVNDVLAIAGHGMLSQAEVRETVGLDYSGTTVVIETPRWYGANNRVDVNDLLGLAEHVGELRSFYAGMGLHVEQIWPRTWKGTVPDDIMQKRILNALSKEERERVPLRPRARDVNHNISDAIGIGLWRLGRLK